MRCWTNVSKDMPLAISTMRAAALMPDWVYFHLAPGSYCMGAARNSGMRSASVRAVAEFASPRPEVWVSSWAMVRLAGLPEGVFRSANAGMCLATGSLTESLPSSWSMSTATAVTGLVIEAIQKIEFACIGRWVARSARPVASRWRILSFVATTVTAPAISCLAMAACRLASTRGKLEVAQDVSMGSKRVSGV